jgi:hypothetical protein
LSATWVAADMKRGSTSKSHWDKIEKDRMKTIVSIIVLFALCTILRADEALHHIELKSCANFEVISPLGIISVFPVSERMQRVVQAGNRKTIIAADYSVGVILRTKKPQLALQSIVKQIHEQTGRPLGTFMNGSLDQMAPSAMLIATDADSVWCLVLTPKGDQPDTYLLSCGFVIDRKKEPNTVATTQRH